MFICIHEGLQQISDFDSAFLKKPLGCGMGEVSGGLRCWLPLCSHCSVVKPVFPFVPYVKKRGGVVFVFDEEQLMPEFDSNMALL